LLFAVCCQVTDRRWVWLTHCTSRFPRTVGCAQGFSSLSPASGFVPRLGVGANGCFLCCALGFSNRWVGLCGYFFGGGVGIFFEVTFFFFFKKSPISFQFISQPVGLCPTNSLSDIDSISPRRDPAPRLAPRPEPNEAPFQWLWRPKPLGGAEAGFSKEVLQ